jgi:hypothetical protein
MKRKTKNDEEQRLADEARLLRDWLAWHREERKTVLAGPHGAMFERLLYILKTLTPKSAPLLLAYVRGIDWSIIDSPTRLIVLHEINNAITDLRTRHGLAPFDDGWPSGRESVFVTVRQLLFPAQAAPPGAQPGSVNTQAKQLCNEV